MTRTFALLFAICCSYSCYAQITQTLACDNCGYQDAIDLAQSLHQPPTCIESNREDGMLILGTTEFECFSHPKTLIVANSLTRDAYKFTVSTQQNSIYSSTYTVTVDNAVITPIEYEALDTFYNIDEHFKAAILEVMQAPVTNSIVQSATPFYKPNAFLNNTTSSPENCESHPANYLYSDDFQKDLKDSLVERISSKIGYRETWTQFTSTTQVVGGGLTISKDGIGIHVNQARNSEDYYVSQLYGDVDNILNFRVAYHGSTYIGDYSVQYIPPADFDYGPERVLNLSFEFLPGSSKIGGYTVTQFSHSSLNIEGEENNCLRQIIEQNQESQRLISINEDGTGTIIGEGVGGLVNPIVNGPTVTVPGVFRNLAGCKLVELETTVECPDGSTSRSITARWIEC